MTYFSFVAADWLHFYGSAIAEYHGELVHSPDIA
jgi:hypothetical protein